MGVIAADPAPLDEAVERGRAGRADRLVAEVAGDPVADRGDARAAVGPAELGLDERLEAVRRAIARIEQVLDRFGGQLVRLEPGQRGDVGEQTVHFGRGGIADLEPAVDVKPDPLADVVLRGDARDVFGRAHGAACVVDALLGDRRGLELQQHVRQAVDREREAGGNGDGHVSA